MKITLEKEEFEQFALDTLRVHYDKLIPVDKKAVVTRKYDGTVEIEFEEMEVK